MEKSLKLLNYSGHIPNLREIQSEVLKRSMITVSCIMEVMIVVLMKEGEALDIAMLLSNTQDADEYRRKIFSNPVFVSAAEKYLRFLYKRGMLDMPQN